jgi:tRNA(Ile)-lysidine synthase
MEIGTTLQEKWQKYQITDVDFVIIGVSGGVDSMVLLDAVVQIHPASKIIVVHVDHSIRPESQEDAEFVAQACKKYGVVYEGTRVDITKVAKQEKISVEMAGRAIRYGYFERVRALYQAKWILTAHHQDDVVETVLINLIRWTRLRGLSGIEERQGVLLRPLLAIEKSKLLSYAQKNAISFREDSTNEDLEYVRNRVRHEIIPQMEIINPMVRKTLANFAGYARELDQMTEGLIGVHLSGNSITEDTFVSLPKLLQFTFLEKVYASVHGGTIGLSSGNLEEMRRFISEARGGTTKEIGNLRLEKRDRNIKWSTVI